MVRRSSVEHDQRRGSARERGYTARWDRAAKLYLQDHPLCLGCEAVGVTAGAELVDHVVPHKGDAEAFWNAELWQPCCRWHHDVVKQKLELRYADGKLEAAELWLNSATATALTKRERTSVSADGWVT